MSLLTRADVGKGFDTAGIPIASSEDPAASIPGGMAGKPRFQNVLLVDAYGNPIGSTSTGAQAVVPAVSVTNSARVKILTANANRAGFYIIHMGATIWWNVDDDTDLSAFLLNALPLIATQPLTQQFFGPVLYKGDIWAACQSGEGATDVRVMEYVF